MNRDIDKNSQKVWDKYKDHHQAAGYELKNSVDIYLPFWQCKQNVVVETELEMDRFSRIILELIRQKMSKHSKICAFLGVKEDSFVLVQFHFLLKNNLIREIAGEEYEITCEGISFLENKTKPTCIETFEFEYFVNDMTQDFFNPNKLIDGLSAGKKKDFWGYVMMHSNQLKKTNNSKEIVHKSRPTFSLVSKERTNFTAFFNAEHQDKRFYDFADKHLEAHKKNICFQALLFEKTDNRKERFLEIRQSNKSIKNYKEAVLEELLTKTVSKYIRERPKFI